MIGRIGKRLKRLFRRDTVAFLAVAAALLSCLLTPPDAGYAAYIDWRVLGVLFCLMLAAAACKELGLFAAAAQSLPALARDQRSLGLLLMNGAFFGSMLVTNDVSLLMLTPLTVSLLAGKCQTKPDSDRLIRLVVLLTAAANLGSMLTPVGNPQNLYIYSHYQMTFGAFFSTVFPWTALGFVLLNLLTFCNGGGHLSFAPRSEEKRAVRPPLYRLVITAAMFAAGCLAVLRVLPWYWVAAAVLPASFFISPRLLLKIDWGLLLTFAAFFIFVGNLSRIDGLSAALGQLLQDRELGVSLLTSQIISNVPAAVLLSGFTDQAPALLLGVDLGGLGTPVASLASLISMRIYLREAKGSVGRYLLIFSIYNFALLAIFYTLTLIL